MSQEMTEKLKSAIAFSGLNRVARELNLNPVSLAIVLLSPARATPESHARTAMACKRVALDHLQPPEIMAISGESRLRA